jgi:hypothetical protein
MKWPWHKKQEELKRAEEEARQARERVKLLEEETRETVHKVFRVKHENHIGEAFDEAFFGGRA